MQAFMIDIYAMVDGCKVLFDSRTRFTQRLIDSRVDLTFDRAPLKQHALQAFYSSVDKAFIAYFYCICMNANL